MSNESDPAYGAVAITPTNGLVLGYANGGKKIRGLWIGGAGNLKVTMGDGSVVTFVGINAGTLLPVCVKTVESTSTTATSILALY